MSALSSFRFSQPILTKLAFEMRGPVPTPPEKISNNLNIHRSIAMIEGKRQAAVEITVQVNKKDDIIQEDAPFYIEAAMQSMFEWDDSVDEALAQKLLNFNAAALLISYIRPLISTITTSAPIPVYNLPYIDLKQLFNQNEENK